MMMYTIFTLCVLFALANCAITNGRYNEGRYNEGRYNHKTSGDDGRYRRPKDEGRYVHIPYPYDGGYGPYSGGWERYKHQGDGKWDANLYGEPSEPKPVTVKPTTTTTPYPTIKYINNGNRIIRQNQNLKEDGFKYLYETENKILAEEKAIVKNQNTPDEGIATSGFYQYVGPDGVLYRVTFTADENGFLPKLTRVNYPESLDDGFTKLNTNTIRRK